MIVPQSGAPAAQQRLTGGELHCGRDLAARPAERGGQDGEQPWDVGGPRRTVVAGVRSPADQPGLDLGE
ncbi:hypothetical protein [Paractinoplanes toevensis]|uniref:hypothetical protein n=1 Tax=Paractinoplanes toevensis TaxID=571911 RepID=UPI001BB3975C|nr:hypothetical protein [Actinoplanes toevensis]